MERKPRTIYSNEFKLKAVELSNKRGSLLAVAQELNISRDNLKRWKKEHSEGRIKQDNSTPRTKKQEELIKLRKELYDTQLERDILKKAVGIFSKSDR
jgi:transposase